MRSALARVAVLLSVALALANAQCFTRCLAQPADHSAPPCHSHSKVQTPAPQHDLRPSAGATVQPGATLMMVTVADFGAPASVASMVAGRTELRPPPLDIATTIPLRI